MYQNSGEVSQAVNEIQSKFSVIQNFGFFKVEFKPVPMWTLTNQIKRPAGPVSLACRFVVKSSYAKVTAISSVTVTISNLLNFIL